MPWVFRFHFEKTLESVGVLLRKECSKRMNYMKLLKLLYICDRECIKNHNRPITGDRVVAMKRGPVLSHLYANIPGFLAVFRADDDGNDPDEQD